MHSVTSKPWGFKVRSSTAFVVSAVCLGLFTDTLIFCTIIPILPSALVERANVSQNHVQYYISVMLASSAICFFLSAPLFGHLSDRWGSRKRPFIFGIVANIASLILFMVSTSPVGMTLARAFQGVSSAAVNVVGIALVKDTFAKEKTGQGMAYTSAATQIGLLLGPSIGGVLYDNVGYESVFILPVVLLAIDIVMRLVLIEKPAAKALRKQLVDEENASLSRESSAVMPESSEEDPLLTRTDTSNSQPAISTGRHPLFRLLTRGRMLTALFVSMVDVIQWTALETTLPLFVIRTFDWTASQAGLLFFVGCVPGIILSFFLGKSIDRSGTLLPAAVGVSVASACYMTQRLVRENILWQKILHVGLFTTSNVSMLFVQIIMSAEIGLTAQEVDDESDDGDSSTVGMAYALFMMACSAGQLLGPILGGFMIEKTGWSGMTSMQGILCAIALPSILAFTGGGVKAWRNRTPKLREQRG